MVGTVCQKPKHFVASRQLSSDGRSRPICQMARRGKSAQEQIKRPTQMSSRKSETEFYLSSLMVELRGFEPLTPCVQNSCHTVSGSLSVSSDESKACLYRLTAYHHFSTRWYKKWYSKCLTRPCHLKKHTKGISRLRFDLLGTRAGLIADFELCGTVGTVIAMARRGKCLVSSE